MNTVFIGGSRHVSRLSPEIKKRLDNVIHSGHRVVVGDANGADKAVQKHLQDAAYDKVTVFCSGQTFRNNLGHWETHRVEAPSHLKGFQFYAAKDREMARKADFGLMIWDGKSPGTVLNVLRLVRAGKKAVLFCIAEKRSLNIKTESDWETFLSQCDDELRRDLRERATPDEWQTSYDTSLPGQQEHELPQEAELHDACAPARFILSNSERLAFLNAALVASDSAAFLESVAGIVEAEGMNDIAKKASTSPRVLGKLLSAEGSSEFGTILRVIASLGFRVEIRGSHTPVETKTSSHDPADPTKGKALPSVRKTRGSRSHNKVSLVDPTVPPKDLLL